MERVVEPEILDELPPDDPAAIQSRRELRLINALMGNHRWIRRQVRDCIRPGWRVLELGGGDGCLGRQLVDDGVCAAGSLTGVDLAPRPAIWPGAAAWHRANVLAGGGMPEAEIVVANLFLHHFSDIQLGELGALLPASATALIVSEPERRSLHLWQGRLLSVIACFGPVTRHDMPVSIRAGFVEGELERCLGLDSWSVSTCRTFLGARRLLARRLPA